MDAQPGEKFIYGYNTDILGAVVEKVSGMPLDEFFRTRIFEPLKMSDTSFFLPHGQARRGWRRSTRSVDGKLERAPNPGLGQGDYVDGPRKCFSGGAGAAVDGDRLRAVPADAAERRRARRRAHAQPEDGRADDGEPRRRRSSTRGRRASASASRSSRILGAGGVLGSPGVFAWGGAYHTVYWADPKEKLVAVLMTQLLPANGSDLHNKFRVHGVSVDRRPAESRRPRTSSG